MTPNQSETSRQRRAEQQKACHAADAKRRQLEPIYDFVYANVLICDGKATPLREGHVAVLGDRIAHILPADAPSPLSKRFVDGHGTLVLAPGFIDVHSHSDYTALAYPLSESKIAQGITTEILGNCGFSAAPLRGALLDDEKLAQAHLHLPWDWQSIQEYFDRLDRAQPAVNVASFVGHRNIRAAVMGFADRRPTQEELRAMEHEVEAALEAGALGLSTGLIYIPGLFANTDELIELAKVVARHGGLYASHVRGEGDRLVKAAEEFFEIVDRASVAAQYSHLKASGRRNWGKVRYVIEQIEKRRSEGALVAFDRYPYTASSTELSSLLPRWVFSGGREETLERLAQPQVRRQIRKELEEDFGDASPWNDILLAKISDKELSAYCGWQLSAMARHLGTDEFDLFFDLLLAGRLEVWICHFTMSEDDMVTVLTHPLCMVCTDAESHSFHKAGVSSAPHPRGFAAFVKFLRYFVREHRLLALEEAVRKMTSFPAQMFGLTDRGIIAAGYAADLVLFDPEAITDKAEFGKTPLPAAGIELVMVNGIVSYERGTFTGQRAGRVLRRKNH